MAAPPHEQVEHAVRARLGLAGCDDIVYSNFPPLGLGGGRLDSWLKSPVIAPLYRTRNAKKPEDRQWNSIAVYGQPARALKWDLCRPLIDTGVAQFAEEICRTKPSFTEAAKLTAKSGLPCCQSDSLSRLLLVGKSFCIPLSHSAAY